MGFRPLVIKDYISVDVGGAGGVRGRSPGVLKDYISLDLGGAGGGAPES